MSETYGDTYGDDAREHQLVGGFLIGTVSLVAAVSVILSLYAWINPPGQVPPPPPAHHPLTLADRYLVIAGPADRQLAAEEKSFLASERGDLIAAESDLLAEVTTIQSFDKRLAAIAFPAAITTTVHALILDDQRRVSLIARQARSASLRRLQSFDRRVQAASAAVAAEANLLSKTLNAPTSSG
ncbi:MAG TPA: hypothetical protein VMI33_15305 [Streptosporangiaceae bacterium]|nr:hypothetical protein [Streptosporangiaceae bacterium]